jgi:transcriptional regulator with XRE-family HTH domain
LNETLCRALLQARLTEEDVAAHLQVDPKTVRRWLEGRVPYLRHRWAIATMLGADETDLWPQLRTARTRPEEVVAVYPHRDTVPRDVWLRVFGSARQEIGILEDVGVPVGADRPILAGLAERARSGVSMRICLHDPDASRIAQRVGRAESGGALTASVRDALAIYAPLREKGGVEIRLHPGIVYSSIYYGGDQLLVSQHTYGTPVGSGPILHLRRAEGGDMVAAYLDAFDHTWAAARAAE